MPKKSTLHVNLLQEKLPSVLITQKDFYMKGLFATWAGLFKERLS